MTTDKLSIHLADNTDAAAISELILPLAERYVVHEFRPQARQALLESMGTGGITKLMADGCVYHLARRDGRVVGAVGILDCRHLYHLFVAEEYQHQGIARRLWHVAMQKCLTSGASGEFSVNASRYALPFYQKLGFVARAEAQERNGIITIPMVYHALG
jgi:GNAT superfamily N-acetyltransferase